MRQKPMEAWLEFSVRIYRALLILYPDDYRHNYGSPMVQVFRDMSREVYQTQGTTGLGFWWFTTAFDLIRTVIQPDEKVRKQKIKGSGSMKMQNMVRMVVLTAFILLVPLVAMQFTNEVNWGLEDFVAGGVLLLGMGLLYELVAWKMQNVVSRTIVGAGVVLVVLFIWAQLAVGLLGD